MTQVISFFLGSNFFTGIVVGFKLSLFVSFKASIFALILFLIGSPMDHMVLDSLHVGQLLTETALCFVSYFMSVKLLTVKTLGSKRLPRMPIGVS